MDKRVTVQIGTVQNDRDQLENRMPNPGPGGRRRGKLVFTVLPAGTSAEEAAELLKEFAKKHKESGSKKDGDEK
jgi:hypothetical protein